MAHRMEDPKKHPAAQMDDPKAGRKPTLEVINGMVFVPLRPGVRKAA